MHASKRGRRKTVFSEASKGKTLANFYGEDDVSFGCGWLSRHFRHIVILCRTLKRHLRPYIEKVKDPKCLSNGKLKHLHKRATLLKISSTATADRGSMFSFLTDTRWQNKALTREENLMKFYLHFVSSISGPGKGLASYSHPLLVLYRVWGKTDISDHVIVHHW